MTFWYKKLLCDLTLTDRIHLLFCTVHERDINTDFTLTLLRRAVTINPQLRVILMSATASAQLFTRYFEAVGIQPDLINIPGRSYPVDIHWIADCERMATSRVNGWSPKVEDSKSDNNGKSNNHSSKHLLSPRAKDKIDN